MNILPSPTFEFVGRGHVRRYTVPLESGRTVTVEFKMPFAHRIAGLDGSVRPTDVYRTKTEGAKTKRMSPAIEAEISDIVEASVEAEAQAMERSRIRPIAGADLRRYREEYGHSLDLDRLVHALRLEDDPGMLMHSAWEISAELLEFERLDKEADELRDEVGDLEKALEKQQGEVAESPSQEELLRVERLEEAFAGLKLHGESVLEFAVGNTTLEKVIDYMEQAAA